MHVMGQSGLFHIIYFPLFRFDLRHARLTFLTVVTVVFLPRNYKYSQKDRVLFTLSQYE
jgi:hypothetical protein